MIDNTLYCTEYAEVLCYSLLPTWLPCDDVIPLRSLGIVLEMQMQGALDKVCSACQDQSPTEWNRAQNTPIKTLKAILVLVIRVSCC
jgi:hypothetical protein